MTPFHWPHSSPTRRYQFSGIGKTLPVEALSRQSERLKAEVDRFLADVRAA
jgi:hypothetical protein